jgi:uncharacterized membrane protein
MMRFAVASFRENGLRGILSHGIGRPMLQIRKFGEPSADFGGEMISSLIVGPIATCAFELELCRGGSGKMGTAGLVGLFGTIEGSGEKIPRLESWSGNNNLSFRVAGHFEYRNK